MQSAVSGHPFVFQVRVHEGLGLRRAADELAEALSDQPVQISYASEGSPAILGVVEDCSQREAGRLIGRLRRLSVSHPYVKVTLAGYGSDLPPTVLEDGQFTLFGERYRVFCEPEASR